MQGGLRALEERSVKLVAIGRPSDKQTLPLPLLSLQPYIPEVLYTIIGSTRQQLSYLRPPIAVLSNGPDGDALLRRTEPPLAKALPQLVAVSLAAALAAALQVRVEQARGIPVAFTVIPHIG